MVHRIRVCIFRASLLVVALASAGCSADAGQGSMAKDNDGAAETTSSATEPLFACHVGCFGWECYNTCEDESGTVCVAKTQWLGHEWSSWSGYNCSQN